MSATYQGMRRALTTTCYVDGSAQIIGDVAIGDRSSIWMNAVVRGDVNSIVIGAEQQRAGLQRAPRHANKYKVIVGDWVTIGHSVTLHGCTSKTAA